MAKKSKDMKFANESQEAAWWQANESRLSNEFEKITAVGGIGPATFVIA